MLVVVGVDQGKGSIPHDPEIAMLYIVADSALFEGIVDRVPWGRVQEGDVSARNTPAMHLRSRFSPSGRQFPMHIPRRRRTCGPARQKRDQDPHVAKKSTTKRDTVHWAGSLCCGGCGTDTGEEARRIITGHAEACEPAVVTITTQP